MLCFLGSNAAACRMRGGVLPVERKMVCIYCDFLRCKKRQCTPYTSQATVQPTKGLSGACGKKIYGQCTLPTEGVPEGWVFLESRLLAVRRQERRHAYTTHVPTALSHARVDAD